MGNWVRQPEPDSEIERFRDGLVALYRDGTHAGYVATSLDTFTTLFSRQGRWWVWLIVIFNDGTRHIKIEDYPPWTYVREMLDGHFDWQESTEEDGPFSVEWLPSNEARRIRDELNVKPQDF